MSSQVLVACLQMNSSASVEENLGFVEQSAIEAKQAGVELLLLPENFAQMPKRSADLHKERGTSGEVQDFLAKLSGQIGMHIIAGSVPVLTPPNRLPFTRSIVFNEIGSQIATYNKLHLFDVSLENGESYRESASYQAGELRDDGRLNVVRCGSVQIGLSICYDLRFPEMYRALVQQGAEVITVPAAFTFATGQSHWEVLLKARAIENQAYVMAAAQVGEHENGRKTWGNSMIIDPTGKIISQFEPLSLEVGLVLAEIDLELMRTVRRDFPVQEHRRIL